MIITITGPRSVGKTTISKILAKEMGLKRVSSDELSEKALKDRGGLDKAIKTNKIAEFIENEAVPIIKKEYEKDDLIFEMAGGAISDSKKFSKVTKEVRELAKKKSIIIGLLPSKNKEESINFLFEREQKRKHFKLMEKKELLEKVKKDYNKYPALFEDICQEIIFVKDKTPSNIVKEIISKIKK